MNLGQDVLDATQFQHVSHSRARLDTRSRSGGNENDVATTKLADDAMGNGVTLERNALLPFERFLGVFGSLFNCRRNFIGLAIAASHPPSAIPDDNKGIEAETPAA